MGSIGENMESSFQFTNPVLSNIEFSYNDAFNNQENKEVQISMNMSINIEKQENSNEALVGLTVTIGGTNEDPFYVKATEKANFRWESSLDDSVVEGLLNQNAPALLLSYLRPIIVQVTAASPISAYNIPFINFTRKE